MKKLLLVLFTSILTSIAFSQTDSVASHARELLEVTGSVSVGTQVINNMVASFKKQFPVVPEEFWDEVSKEFNCNELVELVIPIYSKYYTDEELIKLIEFYKSPLGQKVVKKLPLITQDSYYVGQEWGRKIGEKVLARMKEKGLLKEN